MTWNQVGDIARRNIISIAFDKYKVALAEWAPNDLNSRENLDVSLKQLVDVCGQNSIDRDYLQLAVKLLLDNFDHSAANTPADNICEAV